MITGRHINYLALISIFLVVIIATGSAVIWSRYSHGQTIEIKLAPQPELQGEIDISGSVNNPGGYPLTAGDSIADILDAAGGTTEAADLSRIRLYIPEKEEDLPPQKVNLNRADRWLLEALPGIGETKAQAIIDYRQQNGPFHNITELLNVEGISIATYEKIKDLITVAD